MTAGMYIGIYSIKGYVMANIGEVTTIESIDALANSIMAGAMVGGPYGALIGAGMGLAVYGMYEWGSH